MLETVSRLSLRRFYSSDHVTCQILLGLENDERGGFHERNKTSLYLEVRDRKAFSNRAAID